MCRSPEINRREGRNENRSKHARSSGNGLESILPRPSWGALVGLGGFRRIEDPELRENVLQRTPAYLNLPATTRKGKLKRQAEPLIFDNFRTQQKNDQWDLELDAYGQQPQKKHKKLRLLDELQQGLLRPKEEVTKSEKWKGLDDLVDMAYKIRVSGDQFGWDKLLEEDIEEEDSDLQKEASS